MGTTDGPQRGTLTGIVAVWVVAALICGAVALAAPPAARASWLLVGLGGCLVVAFAVQLGYATPHRFIARMGASMVGALVVFALAGGAMGVAALVAA